MQANAMNNTSSQIRPTNRSNQGMTLIDMLVSLAIIMMLIATLLPALVEVRRASKRAVCMTHEFEHGKFMERYAQEHNGYFPQFQYSFAYTEQALEVSTQTRDYREAGWDYFLDAQTTCPEELEPGKISYLDANNQVQLKAMSYGMNIDLIVRKVRMYDLRNASSTVTMYDGSMSGTGDGGKNIVGSYSGTYDMIDYARENRHYREMNVLFADGHVERKLRMDPPSLAANGSYTFVAAAYALETTGGGDGSTLTDDSTDSTTTTTDTTDTTTATTGTTTTTTDTTTDSTDSTTTTTTDNGNNGNGNNGHGNNDDGVDSSNPGNGNGGPNGGNDPSGDVDDESNNSGNNGNGNGNGNGNNDTDSCDNNGNNGNDNGNCGENDNDPNRNRNREREGETNGNGNGSVDGDQQTSGNTENNGNGEVTDTSETGNNTNTNNTGDTSDDSCDKDKGKNNNGHGNNEDGVDSSNPGQGNGGPNGGDDPSGDVDDESKGGNSSNGKDSGGCDNSNNGNNGNGNGNGKK